MFANVDVFLVTFAQTWSASWANVTSFSIVPSEKTTSLNVVFSRSTILGSLPCLNNLRKVEEFLLWFVNVAIYLWDILAVVIIFLLSSSLRP